MKLAVPTRNNQVDAHFGHCEFYTLFHIGEKGNIEKSETLASPQGCGCKSNIAAILKEKGVDVMLAGNMGEGALNVLNRHGISVYRGCSGDVQKVAEAYLEGLVVDSGIGCGQHEQHHGKGNEHHGQHSEGHRCNH